MRVGLPRSSCSSGGGVGGGGSGLFGLGCTFGFTAATSDGHVTEYAAFGPVTAAALAEVARLREVVIVVVAEFGVERFAAWALEGLLVVQGVVRPKSPVHAELPASTSSAAA